jgi:hypothetical protein
MPTRLQQLRMSDSPTAEPIVEDARLARMTGKARRPRLIGGKVQKMPDDPKPGAGGRDRMDPLPTSGLGRQRSRRKATGDQVPIESPAGARRSPAERLASAGLAAAGVDEGEGYVRMRVRVAGDEISIEGLKRVPGPVVAHEPLQGELAYEVTVGDRSIASGSVPDAGSLRAFAPPNPEPGQEGHHFEPATSYEFVARVPAESMTLKTLPRTNVAVYRVKEPVDRRDELLARGEPSAAAIGPAPAPVAERYPRELRLVGRLSGIKLDDLAPDVRAQARRSLR